MLIAAILLNLVLLSLLLLQLLGRALPLALQPLVLRFDLVLAEVGFAAAAGAGRLSAFDILQCSRMETATHVNSTLILLAGDFPSSNEEWWYDFRHDFMRSKFSNSTKPKPRHFSGWFRSVATRTSAGGFFSKCLVTDWTSAVKGRFPGVWLVDCGACLVGIETYRRRR